MKQAYCAPANLSDALSVLSESEWKILAGGTDFYPSLGDKLPSEPVLDISKISGLDLISLDEAGNWTIGASATWTDLRRTELPAAFDALKLAAREVGSVQIQNRATLVGNLCNASPAADGVPPLLAMEAHVRLQSQSGQRDLPLAAFIQGNRKTDLRRDEMMTHIIIPQNGARGTSSFIKLGARKYLVISIAMVAARLAVDDDGVIEDAAISVGACSEVALRLAGLEQSLIGQKVTIDFSKHVSSKHLSALSPIDDVRASGPYRMEASRELIIRALNQTVGG